MVSAISALHGRIVAEWVGVSFHQSFIRTGAAIFFFGATGAGAISEGSLFEATGAGTSSGGRGRGNGGDDAAR